MPPPHETAKLRRLHTALEHLAWPAARQREYLVELGVAPLADELALEFDDAFRTVQAMAPAFGLSSTTHEALRAIDLILSEMSKMDTAVWHVDSLANATPWAEVRQLALALRSELPHI